ncbi:MAG: RluA family pseudouridine synthase [Schleiferiaceae bacterium]|nr:RluA family pseudouridine synthase [Schleiferiaceae bacterium]
MEKEPQVLYLDGWIAVIVKPAGLMVEPDRLGHPNVQDWGEEQWGGKTWAVHRLDRPTSGLLVVARKKTSCSRLMEQFEKRQIGKRYVLKTSGVLPGGEWFWEDQLEKRSVEFRSVVVEAPLGQRASMRGLSQSETEAEVELFTGRYHQIRAQASHRNLPILGDEFYGGEAWPGEGIALHACYLRFNHPQTGEMMEYRNYPDWYIPSVR